MSEYYGNNDWRDYLAHYGVPGMKWGVRRYQSYSTNPRRSGKKGKELIKDGSSFKYQRTLNRADKDRATILSKRMKSDRKYSIYSQKSKRAKALGKTKKAAKYEIKALLNKKDRDSYKQLQTKIESFTKSVIAEATKNGFGVAKKDTLRSREKAKQYLMYKLFGVEGAAAVSFRNHDNYKGKFVTKDSLGRTIDQSPTLIKGTKYKVIKKKRG